MLLHISGSHPPPWLDIERDITVTVDADGSHPDERNRYFGRGALDYYQVLFYETRFYAPFVQV